MLHFCKFASCSDITPFFQMRSSIPSRPQSHPPRVAAGHPDGLSRRTFFGIAQRQTLYTLSRKLCYAQQAPHPVPPASSSSLFSASVKCEGTSGVYTCYITVHSVQCYCPEGSFRDSSSVLPSVACGIANVASFGSRLLPTSACTGIPSYQETLQFVKLRYE
jgi:hypothetical protein